MEKTLTLVFQIRMVRIDENLCCPDALTIDFNNKKLYFLDSCKGVLESVSLKPIRNRCEASIHDPEFSSVISKLGTNFYWHLYDININGIDEIEEIDEIFSHYNKSLGTYLENFSYDIFLNNNWEDPCYYTWCTYLCLRKGPDEYLPSYYACVDWPTKMFMVTEELLIGYKQNLVQIRLEEEFISVHQTDYSKFRDYNISRLAQSTYTKDIYIADNDNKCILKCWGGRIEDHIELVVRDIGQISSLQTYHKTNNLYWTDSEKRTLEVISMTTKLRKILHQFDPYVIPLGLHIVPFSGDIFLVTKIGSILNMFHFVGSTEVTTYPLRATIRTSERLSMCGVDNVTFLAIGTRLVQWNIVAHVETETKDKYPSKVNQMVHRREIDNKVYWTGDDGKLYWKGIRKGPLKEAVITRNNTILEYRWTKTGEQNPRNGSIDEEAPKDFPIIVNYENSVYNVRLEEHYERFPCLLDNGGCSDICNSVGDGQKNCSCGDGRKVTSSNPNICEHIGSCPFSCGNGVCLNTTDICDGLANCQDGSDEKNCSPNEYPEEKYGLDTLAILLMAFGSVLAVTVFGLCTVVIFKNIRY